MICKISFINKHGYPEHCVEEAAFADYDEKIANEEAWAKTLCRRHYILAKLLAKAKHLVPGTWISYPEHGTVTIPKEKKMAIQKTYTLDELLSPAALADLNGEGSYVNFSFKNDDGTTSSGWFSRKKKTTIDFEIVCINTLCS